MHIPWELIASFAVGLALICLTGYLLLVPMRFFMASAGRRRAGRAGADAGEPGGRTAGFFGEYKSVHGHGGGLSGPAGGRSGGCAAAADIKVCFLRWVRVE